MELIIVNSKLIINNTINYSAIMLFLKLIMTIVPPLSTWLMSDVVMNMKCAMRSVSGNAHGLLLFCGILVSLTTIIVNF